MLRVRELTTEERETITRWAQSRTEPARRVERARIISRAAGGATVRAIATALGLEAGTVRLWLKRFNATGLAGLEDRHRRGRPPTYSREQVGEVVATALTDPQTLGLPFASWTLDRLQAYLNEVKQIPIKRNRIDELLLAEGLRWRTQETWFGKRVDPDFAAKRGRLKPSTPAPQPAA